ncbi:MAG TPA: type IV secretion system DNA-binding domain-containing protein [Bryobacteraceae bacterium]|nr:type IV secretion system DNA-binding domain-containing protein [Bryobacteraceae bacterium]
MRYVVENRSFVSFLLACGIGLAIFFHWPFPVDDPLLGMIRLERPGIYSGIRFTWTAMMFTTPYMVSTLILSFAYVFAVGPDRKRRAGKLPPYLLPASRPTLSVIVGELHHAKRREAAESPRWLEIPVRGLYTGTVIFGAIGSGKTSCCMYPFAEQILAFAAKDEKRKAAGLVLEVKGDFCHQVRGILERHGRGADYIELNLGGKYCYNPLNNDLEAYALAYGVASLLNNLFGKGKEPFWQQAYTNLVKFIILLHKVLNDYVTLFEVYECAINPALLADRIEKGRQMFATRFVLVEKTLCLQNELLANGLWVDYEQDPHYTRWRETEDLTAYLTKNDIPFEILTRTVTDPGATRKQRQFEAVQRWFEGDWSRIEPKLRTSIVEGISVFLSLFDDNPTIKDIFCPPKECFNREANADARHGVPMPGFVEMIESGKVIALNFPTAANPGLAKAIGTLMKQDFQRAMLGRIPQMEERPAEDFRPVMFLCDEYQAFAIVGESDPTGDEKFFAQSRQAKCIPIVATQSISSLRSTLPGETWRTLLQTFRTKIFLCLSDDFSARTAADLCGKEEQPKLNYSISESGQDANVSLFSGRTTAHKSSVSTSKSYSLQRDYVFEPKVFSELKNAESIVLAYDGVNPMPPAFCYLKPFFRQVDLTWFEQVEKGLI